MGMKPAAEILLREKTQASFSRADWKLIEEAVHARWARSLVRRGRDHPETATLMRLWLEIRGDVLGIRR